MTGTQDSLGAKFSSSVITLLDEVLRILPAIMHRITQNQRLKGPLLLKLCLGIPYLAMVISISQSPSAFF